MKKFLTVALAGVLAASMLFTGCSKKEESKVPDKLIVGTNAEFPPFEYMNDKKQPDGFDIAMIKEIGKRMDKKVEIQNMEFKSLIGAMESESINTVSLLHTVVLLLSLNHPFRNVLPLLNMKNWVSILIQRNYTHGLSAY